jgi:hypothetical protein
MWLRGENSISDSSHYLPDLRDPSRPRRAVPISRVAAKVTDFVLRNMASHPPLIAIDLHEDEDSPRRNRSYLYSQGPLMERDPLARAVIAILRRGQIPPVKAGLTVSDETIIDGIVTHRRHRPILDGSIDELFGTPRLIRDGRATEKKPAKTVLVLETPIKGISLGERVQVHSSIVTRLQDLWMLVCSPALQTRETAAP